MSKVGFAGVMGARSSMGARVVVVARFVDVESVWPAGGSAFGPRPARVRPELGR